MGSEDDDVGEKDDEWRAFKPGSIRGSSGRRGIAPLLVLDARECVKRESDMQRSS